MRSLLVLSLTLCPLGAAVPTFHKDVLPILQRSCQGCHRAGEAAPMAFLSYKETRPWASAIREAVLSKKMPPWSADPAHGQFRNDPTLPEKDIRTLAAWAEGKAPEGNAKDAPPPKEFVQGWNIGQPDIVYELPKPYEVPAQGTIEYTRYIIPTGFTEDRWVQAAEVRPGNRVVVHHVIAYLREPGSKWLAGAPVGEPIVKLKNKGGDDGARQHLVGYAPGLPVKPLRPGQARLVKAGTDLVIEMHYTTNGKPATDLTRIGVVFSKEPPQERVFTSAAANLDFVIPAESQGHPVTSKITFYQDAKITGLGPHMHLRGKSFRFELVEPTGERRTLLNVPRYDFNWQHFYDLAEPLMVKAGTVIECFATFDNSANNRHNPDPKVEVKWGDQSWEEMMIGFMTVAIDVKRTPGDVFRKPATAPRPSSGGE